MGGGELTRAPQLKDIQDLLASFTMLLALLHHCFESKGPLGSYIRLWDPRRFLVMCTLQRERNKSGTALTRSRQRPYHAENTSSRPITEVKQHRARLVLGWVTAWEHRVSLSLFVCFFNFFFNRFYRRNIVEVGTRIYQMTCHPISTCERIKK